MTRLGNDQISCAISNVENLAPQIIRQITREISELQLYPAEGIQILINEEDITDIKAIIEGPAGTPYYGGSFKIKVSLSKDYPQSPPKAFFLTKIFHPNVAKTGEICVNTLKKDWKSDLGINHILLTVKCLLIMPNAESALNEEAGKLLLEHYNDYFDRAKMMTEIHAQKLPKSSKTAADGCNVVEYGGSLSKKFLADKKLSAEKKKILKDKKKNYALLNKSFQRHNGRKWTVFKYCELRSQLHYHFLIQFPKPTTYRSCVILNLFLYQ
ncbi:ubiquitin-conjugating enzyme E2 S [Copidosoma floridanum]|uniref:ubiquitin-conjugating enzyme E2 S n=1 Tax=Copidosoma floridanum TaxID=29053 RepID=UPI0006C9E3C6|nr:ubiquitin-conjugating enzyme E2 S [Copidosoma floridanum]